MRTGTGEGCMFSMAWRGVVYLDESHLVSYCRTIFSIVCCCLVFCYIVLSFAVYILSKSKSD